MNIAEHFQNFKNGEVLKINQQNSAVLLSVDIVSGAYIYEVDVYCEKRNPLFIFEDIKQYSKQSLEIMGLVVCSLSIGTDKKAVIVPHSVYSDFGWINHFIESDIIGQHLRAERQKEIEAFNEALASL